MQYEQENENKTKENDNEILSINFDEKGNSISNARSGINYIPNENGK